MRFQFTGQDCVLGGSAYGEHVNCLTTNRGHCTIAGGGNRVRNVTLSNQTYSRRFRARADATREMWIVFQCCPEHCETMSLPDHANVVYRHVVNNDAKIHRPLAEKPGSSASCSRSLVH